MTEVYVITLGDYSDYTIVGVYLDRDLAQKRLDWERDNDTQHFGYDMEVWNAGTSGVEYAGPAWITVWYADPRRYNDPPNTYPKSHLGWYEGVDPGPARCVDYGALDERGVRYLRVVGESQDAVEALADSLKPKLRDAQGLT